MFCERGNDFGIVSNLSFGYEIVCTSIVFLLHLRGRPDRVVGVRFPDPA